MRKIKYIVLHCTAGPQTQTVADIQHYWKKYLKWKSPGYHYLIRPDGVAENLQPIEKPTNGVKGFNAHSIHISYIGGVESLNPTSLNSLGRPVDNRTEAQRKTMEGLVRVMNQKFPDAVILGHRDFSPDKNRNGIIEPYEWIKACPSFSVKEWLDEIGFKTVLQKPVLVTTTGVNIRSGPGIEHAPVADPLPAGTWVQKLGEGDGWTYVHVEDIKGWVSSKYLK